MRIPIVRLSRALFEDSLEGVQRVVVLKLSALKVDECPCETTEEVFEELGYELFVEGEVACWS